MHIDIRWDKVIDIEYHIEEEGIYTICFIFEDGQVCTYGYDNQKEFIKDCTKIANMEV